MRIAYFTDAYLPNVNGVTYAIEGWLSELGKRHEIEVYAPAYGMNSWTERQRKVTVRRYRSIPLVTYKDAHVAIPEVGNIIRSMEVFNPQIVHYHSPGPLGLLGILVAKKMRKPLIGTYHTLYSEVLDYVSIRRKLEKYLKVIDRLVAGVNVDWTVLGENKNGNGETIPQRLTWKVVNKIYGYADVVSCPSNAIKRELVKRGMKRVEVTWLGLDLSKFAPKSKYQTAGKILHVGRLGFEKNVDVVLRAFAGLVDELAGVTLTIVGDGPAMESLRKLTDELGVAGSINFLGMVPRNKLAEIYRKHDVFVTASDMETLGLVVLEAMACGLPVVGVRKYALPDMINSGNNGYLVDPGDWEGMTRFLKIILTDPRLNERLGRQARREAEKHDLTKAVSRLERVYMRLTKLEKPSFWERIKGAA